MMVEIGLSPRFKHQRPRSERRHDDSEQTARHRSDQYPSRSWLRKRGGTVNEQGAQKDDAENPTDSQITIAGCDLDERQCHECLINPGQAVGDTQGYENPPNQKNFDSTPPGAEKSGESNDDRCKSDIPAG